MHGYTADQKKKKRYAWLHLHYPTYIQLQKN